MAIVGFMPMITSHTANSAQLSGVSSDPPVGHMTFAAQVVVLP